MATRMLRLGESKKSKGDILKRPSLVIFFVTLLCLSILGAKHYLAGILYRENQLLPGKCTRSSNGPAWKLPRTMVAAQQYSIRLRSKTLVVEGLNPTGCRAYFLSSLPNQECVLDSYPSRRCYISDFPIRKKGPNWIFKPDAFFLWLEKTFPRFEKRGCSALFYFFPFFLFDLKWTREWRSRGWNGGFMIRIWLLLKTCFVPFSTHIQKIIFFAAFSGCERPLRSRLASLSDFSSFSTNEAILSYLKAFVSIAFNRVMMIDEAQ